MAGLHNIDENGMIYWHCDNPACQHHNCMDWHKDEGCVHHQAEDMKQVGETLSIHISDEDLQWGVHETIIRLPQCPCCGWYKNIRVPTEEECVSATINRDEVGNITSVEVPDDHPAPNLTVIEQRLELIPPDPQQVKTRSARLQSAQTVLEEQYLLQDLLKASRPTYKRVITDVRPHPSVELHTKLAQLMKDNGKNPSG